MSDRVIQLVCNSIQEQASKDGVSCQPQNGTHPRLTHTLQDE